METPPCCSPPPGSPASCEPAGEWIGALEWSLNLDKWLHTDLGGWNEIWYSVAALTIKNIMGGILDLPEVSGDFATNLITGRISPSLSYSLLVHECARSGFHRGPTVPQSGNHLWSLVELVLVLSNEIQWELLPVPLWVRNQLSATQRVDWEAVEVFTSCRMFAPVGIFWGLTSNCIFWSFFYVEKKNLTFATNLNSSRVCARVNAFLSIDVLDPKNVDSGIWML